MARLCGRRRRFIYLITTAMTAARTTSFLKQKQLFIGRKRGQDFATLLKQIDNLMSLLQRACKTLGGLGIVVALPAFVFGQSTNSTNFYAPQGVEYAPVGNLAGDQANPSVALTTTGGFLVWQDNITDGDGLGISAVQLNSGYAPFRVNKQGAGDQENPQVAMLHGGGAVFVWQGGPQSFQHIYAQFRLSNGLWSTTNDIEVNTATNYYQLQPAVAVLTNGNVVVTWGCFGQDNADGLQGVYAQILSPTGQKIGSEFQVNQITPYNQRTPAIAAFPNGNFMIAWVSERQRSVNFVISNGLGYANATNGVDTDTVDIYARVFNAAGAPVTNTPDILINTSVNFCANPSVSVGSDGSYMIAWSQKDTSNLNNSWDVWARPFSSSGVGGTAQYVNTQLYGDQYAPKLSCIGTTYLAVWTSLGQDGSREGVFGQFLNGDGSHLGGEFGVNTTVVNQQMFPAVASDGVGKFLVVWSGYVNYLTGLDLFGQSYASSAAALSAPPAPYVQILDSESMDITWPPVQGYTVSSYQLFVDGSATPVTTTNDSVPEINTFLSSSTHTFQLAYTVSDGRVSPLSAIASGTTWGPDGNGDGLPDDWQTLYWGKPLPNANNPTNWPPPNALLAPGVTVRDVFLWGANPLNPSTWLKQWITHTSQGLFLNWNTVPGSIYQVQISTDLENWTPLGAPRFEAGSTDSLYLGTSGKGYYQIVRNRY
jgi:hypothetical protein